MALCLASKCRGCVVIERGVVYSQLLYCPKILSGGSLCGKSCVEELVEILLCEGGDVELGARTSKHISVFAFDPLSLTLSLTLCLALIHIVISYTCLCCLCVPILVFNQESFTSHLNSYSEEFRGVSPKPFTGNSATLFGYTKCVALSF